METDERQKYPPVDEMQRDIENGAVIFAHVEGEDCFLLQTLGEQHLDEQYAATHNITHAYRIKKFKTCSRSNN